MKIQFNNNPGAFSGEVEKVFLFGGNTFIQLKRRNEEEPVRWYNVSEGVRAITFDSPDEMEQLRECMVMEVRSMMEEAIREMVEASPLGHTVKLSEADQELLRI